MRKKYRRSGTERTTEDEVFLHLRWLHRCPACGLLHRRRRCHTRVAERERAARALPGAADEPRRNSASETISGTDFKTK